MNIISNSSSVLAVSPDPMNVFAGSPFLHKLESGRLIASYEWFRKGNEKEKVPDQKKILTSDDNGDTWIQRSNLDIMWGSLFSIQDKLYCIGNRRGSRDIVIACSLDQGDSWSAEQTLFEGRYHNAPTNIVIKNGYVYRAFETSTAGNSSWKSLVVAGNIQKNLLDPSSWRKSNMLSYPGTPISLSRGKYPANAEQKIPEDGWLEGNIIEVNNTFRVVLRVRMDGEATAGICAICELEDDDPNLNYRFVQFYPMPGAQCKFHIVYDEQSQMYWTTVCLPTNTWGDPEPLRKMGFPGSPGNERRILVLMYSLDALNWFQAGCVAMSHDLMEAYSYASLLIHDEELLVLSRTSQQGKNQHDTNMITLHKINNFRNLALDLEPDFDKKGVK